MFLPSGWPFESGLVSGISKVSVLVVMMHGCVVGEYGSLFVDKVMIVVAIVLSFLRAL